MSKKRAKSATQQALEKEYRKQRKRIQNFISRNTAKGYKFTFDIPDIPKKVTTGSIRRLQAITPEKIYKGAVYQTVDYDTGEITEYTVKQAKEIRKQQGIEKAKQTRQLNKIKKEIEQAKTEFVRQPELDTYSFTFEDMYNQYIEYLRTKIDAGSMRSQAQIDIMEELISSLAAMAVEIDNKYGEGGEDWIESLGVIDIGQWYEEDYSAARMEMASQRAGLNLNFSEMNEDLIDNTNWGMGYLPFNVTDE